MASNKNYASVIGVVRFDPDERKTNSGLNIRTVLVTRPDGQDVRVTLWPQFDDLAIKKGDLLFAFGEASVYESVKNGDVVIYRQLSAYTAGVVECLAPEKGENTDTKGSTKKTDRKTPF